MHELALSGGSIAVTELDNAWITAIPTWLFPVAVIGLVVIGGFFGHLREKRRKQHAQQFARTHGWQWREGDNTLAGQWSLGPFDKGRRRQARNVMAGEHHGWSFLAFDYRYTSGSGKSSRGYDYAVYVLLLPRELPTLEAGPEGMFGGRVARAFGFGDLELGDEELDRMWKVRTDDEEFGRALFHDRMRALLRQTGAWSWGIEHNAMVSWDSGKLPFEEIPQRLDLMSAVLGNVPNEVWQRATPGTGS